MATVTPTYAKKGPRTVITWSGMVTGDTITAYELRETPGLITVHFGGTFANGTSVGLTGSNVDSDYVTARDLADSDITGILAAAGYGVSTNFNYMKPTIASGSSDSVTVTMTIWTR